MKGNPISYHAGRMRITAIAAAALTVPGAALAQGFAGLEAFHLRQPVVMWSVAGGVAASLLLLYFAWRLRRRRIRFWTRMLCQAADDLAGKRDYCQIGMVRGDVLNRLARAFNKISDVMAADEERMTELASRGGDFERLITASQSVLAGLEGLDDPVQLHRQASEAVAEHMGIQRVELWLMRHIVSAEQRPTDTAEAGESGDPDEHLQTDDILSKVGLVPAARAWRDAAAEEASRSLNLPLRPVLETAMSQRRAVTDLRGASSLFGEVADLLVEAGLNAYVSLPVMAQGQLIGVIELYNDRPFSDLQLQVLEFTVDHVGTLIAYHASMAEARRASESLELKNLELAMANRKLERSNNSLSYADRLKGEFLANTSHELRTPLNSILGFAQLITGGSCESEEEIKQYVAAMQDSGERLLKMINEVLDLAKIEAGKMDASLGPIDVRTLLDAVRSLMDVQAQAQGNTIEIRLPDAPMNLLRADHAKLYQILVNIVGNANKFTKDGRITLEVIPESAPGFMRLRVIDTGQGIEPSQLPHMFASFVQADGSPTRKYGGTGLGLTISKKLITLMGGSIFLESKGLGEGTTVTLEIPLWSDDLEDVESAPLPLPDPAQRTVVVIEDYLEFQQYLVEILEAQGWRVATARTAIEGLDLIKRLDPQAIVLDIHLPADGDDPTLQTGYDILRVLGKETQPEWTTPVLVVTAMHREACDALLGQTLLLPIELYSKPLDEEAFLASVERLTAVA